jgi:hypothetical protein
MRDGARKISAVRNFLISRCRTPLGLIFEIVVPIVLPLNKSCASAKAARLKTRFIHKATTIKKIIHQESRKPVLHLLSNGFHGE